ncbi:MAG: Ferrochelatase, protoheme ferro-lyase [Polyangiaceae bacterium]|jgi:ferrochelatase|nr:Ferrochelatase, protoheme ferro-lyase [Polyangiaceae bacterium]
MSFPQDAGVLLVAHGTVDNLDDLGAFVARIRHGRPPPPGLVEELRHRYEAIGGSPLLQTTRQQAAALSKRLEAPVLVGMRLWEPGVERALAGAVALGLSRLVVIALAPFSQHVYWEAALKVAQTANSPIRLIPSAPYAQEPDFVAAHAELIARHAPPEAPLVLSAHSLPRIAIERGDPYARLVEAAAQAVSEKVGRPARLCYQSQGADGGAWLGPDVRETLGALAAEGHGQVAWAPFGFLADHVETLYDLDVEAKSIAAELSLSLVRVPALNLHPGLTDALAAVAIRSLSTEASG